MGSAFSVFTAFKAVDKTSKVLKAIGATSKKTAAGMTSRFRSMSAAFVRSFKTASTKISVTLAKLQRKTALFGRGFKKAFSTGFLVIGLGSFILAGQQAIQTSLQFEQTVVNAAAKFPGAIEPGTKAFKELEATARQIGLTTEFSASAAAGGLEFLAMAGLDATQSMEALPKIVDLATVANIDLARATDIATDTLGAMGLETKDAAKLGINLARVNDVLAKTTVSANTDMENLFETIKKGGPVATAAGASIEQYAALAGVLANAGLKGSDAGTTLKNVFLSLTAVTPKAAGTLKALGVTTKTANGDMRDVVDILDDLDKSMAGLGTAEKAAALKDIFGRIPIAGVNILLKKGAEGIREYQKQLEGASGTSVDMAKIIRSTTLASVKALKSGLEGLGITIFKQVQPAFLSGINSLIKIVRGVNSFIEAHPGMIKMLLTIAKIAAPMVAVAAAIALVNVALGVFSVILAANPIGLIIIAIAGVIALLVMFRKEIMMIGKLVVAVLIAPFILLFKLLSNIPGLGILGGASAALEGFAGKAVQQAFMPSGPQGEGSKIVTPQTALSKQIIEDRKESQTTNRLLIEDGTGRARMAEDGAPGIMQVIPRTAEFDEMGAGA